MRRLFQLLALVSVIGGMALLAGCQKENWGRKGSAKEVKFGAKAHSSVDTRTAYMDYDGTSNHQNIKWLSSDKIRIYSPDAARRNAVEAGPESADNPYYYWADYQIVPDGSDPTKGTLKNLSNDGPSTNPGYDQGEVGDSYDVGNGLVWLNENSATFYGVYPVPSGKNGTGSGVADGQFTFLIPSTQTFSEMGDMDIAFMTAKTSASKGENVVLNFYPDFTAFEISLKSEDQESSVKLKSFTIGTHETGSGDNLNGEYTVNLRGTKSYGLPTDASTHGKTITSTPSSPVTIPAGDTADPLVFTVFALPRTLSNLYIQFNTVDTDGVEKSWKLDLTKKGEDNEFHPIDFAACKKHRIYGLALPNAWQFKVITIDEEDKIDWYDVAVSADTDNYPEATQFVVTGAKNGRKTTDPDQEEYPEGRDNKAYRQYWLFKTGQTVTVSFKILAPEGGTWSVVPQGDTDKFNVVQVITSGNTTTTSTTLSGNIAAKATGDQVSQTTTVTLQITSTSTDQAQLYFKTYVTDHAATPTKYSIDSETQLYDMRGYHYFVLNNKTDQSDAIVK